METEKLGEVEDEEWPCHGCWWRREDLEGLSTLWFKARGGIYLEGFGFVSMRHVLSQLLSEALDTMT